MDNTQDQDQNKEENTKSLFEDISPENQLHEVESMCMNCEDAGITKILLTKIPFFKEVILMNFECPHCGYLSREIQPGQSLADSGIRFEVNVSSARDMSRKVVKSEYATIRFPEIDLEIPSQTQKGKLTTIEGFLQNTHESLSKALNEGVYFDMGGEDMDNKIKVVLDKIDGVLKLKTLPITFFLEDPGGNSFVENPFAPNSDPYCKTTFYQRSREEMIVFYLTNIREWVI
jgi:zinc finger protein